VYAYVSPQDTIRFEKKAKEGLSGGIIYGGDAEEDFKNTAATSGHAVYIGFSEQPAYNRKRDATAGKDVDLIFIYEDHEVNDGNSAWDEQEQ
jgi:hypothetical protein